MSLRVLLTGAAGLLGGELAGRLLARGHGVTALVHRTPRVQRNDRSFLPYAPWTGAAPRDGELLTLPGNVAAPEFGLASGDVRAVARAHDLLIHCAAATGFGLDQSVYDAVNVGGTRHAVAMARAGGLALLHVSTAYVCGARDGPVAEGELAESGFANPYEASKAEAERAVLASGVPFAIARPSVVLGEWLSGAIRGFDATYSAFRLIAEGRVRTIPAAPHATLDFVPIDHVAAGLVEIAEGLEQAVGETFHLTSQTPIPVPEFTAAIGGFSHLHQPRLVDAAAFDPAELPPVERRLHARITGFYDSYFRRAPLFDDSNLRALSGRSCPPTGRAYVERMIAYCIAEGFLSAPPPAEAEVSATAARP